MLSKNDRVVCYRAGFTLAERCIKGYDDVEETLKRAMSSLRRGVDIRFKREIIFFRIFTVYFVLRALDDERFECFLMAFQKFLDEHLDKRLVDKVQDKLIEYGDKFLTETDGHFTLTITDTIVDELLINSGVSVKDYFNVDYTELRRAFNEDCRKNTFWSEGMAKLLLMSEEERVKSFEALDTLAKLKFF